jgi:3-methyladenine DNA glycosylase AlkD
MPKISFKNDRQLGLLFSRAANPAKAEILSRFFKTGPGQYGEGDKFLGLSVPFTRSLVASYTDASDALVEELLVHPYHEVRLLGVLLMVHRYERAKTDKEKAAALKFYLNHRSALNNWDLVDVSVYKVWGDYLLKHPQERSQLYRFAVSSNLWERRMAVVATMALIKVGEFKEILKLSQMLLKDKHDLMHKAVGWMLREVGKKDEAVLIKFLNQFGPHLPRTSLRYAIERLPAAWRQDYLKIKIIK